MRKSSFRWIYLLILLFIAADFYFQLRFSPVPFWQSDWFLWRVLVLLIILFALMLYFAIKHFHNIDIEKQKLINKFINQQDESYRRIASELHDSIGQNLIVLNNEILKVSNSYPADSPEFGELNKMNILLTESVDELRNISSAIFPNKIEKLGLKKAIESMAESAFESSGIQLSFSAGNIDGIFGNTIELNVFRIIQECINNILKHSESSQAGISVHFISGNLVIEVTDNGKGFDTKNIPEKHGLGLDNIRNRTIYCGGSIRIDSKPGKGTKIKILIPSRI
ncbi:MAG: sensor histidine kinase [Ignavibacteriae bacterium]|nr:sensor histidine kinase [Ignavibacteriota bacterium]